MASLTALNTSSDDTLTATDLRNATLIFSYPAAFDIEMIESLGQAQIDFQYPFDIIEMIRPDLINLEIEITVPITPAVTISATGLPSGVTLSGPVSQTYTITGIDSVDDWNTAKAAIEVNIPSAYTGSFEYEVAFNYYQVPDGNTSQTYTVGVARPDALLSASFTFSAPTVGIFTTRTVYTTAFTLAEIGAYIRGLYQQELDAPFTTNITGGRLRGFLNPAIPLYIQGTGGYLFQQVRPNFVTQSGVKNLTLPGVFTDTFRVNLTAKGEVDYSASSTLGAVVGFRRFFDATTYPALATKLTATADSKTAGFGATLSSAFGMTVDAYRFEGIYETQPSVFGMDVQARFDWRSFTKTFNTSFGINIDDTLFKSFDSTQTSAATFYARPDNYPFDYSVNSTIPIDSAVAQGGYGFGKQVRVQNNALFVGTGTDEYSNRDRGDGIYVYDISNPESVTYVGYLRENLSGTSFELGGRQINVDGNSIVVMSQGGSYAHYTYNTTTMPSINQSTGLYADYIKDSGYYSQNPTGAANASYYTENDNQFGGRVDINVLDVATDTIQYTVTDNVANYSLSTTFVHNANYWFALYNGDVYQTYPDYVKVHNLGTSSSSVQINPPTGSYRIQPIACKDERLLTYHNDTNQAAVYSLSSGSVGTLLRTVSIPTGWTPIDVNSDYIVIGDFGPTGTNSKIKLFKISDGTSGGNINLDQGAARDWDGIHQTLQIHPDNDMLVYSDFQYDFTTPFNETEYDVYIMKNVEP